MIKQFLAWIVLSGVAVYFLPQVATALHALVSAHTFISDQLAAVFVGDTVGKLVRGTLSVLAIPLAAALVVGALFWVVKRKMPPYVMEVIWAVWLVLLTALALRA